jgi:protein TonB
MFTDSLCDSRLNDHSRRWTTLVSFGLQALAVSALLTLPFLSTQTLPELSFSRHLMVPIAEAAVPTRPVQQQEANASTNIAAMHIFAQPDHIPHGLPTVDDGVSGPPNLPLGQSNVPGNLPLGIASSIGNSAPVLATVPVNHLRVSVMMEGNLIHRVQPLYPPMAKIARIQGAVVLHAMISREGTIENLQVVSGHSMLVPAAIDAVRQWRYRPYVLNGQPVEVDTQVTVNFVLGGG